MRSKNVNLRCDDSLQGSEGNHCPILSSGSCEFTVVPEKHWLLAGHDWGVG